MDDGVASTVGVDAGARGAAGADVEGLPTCGDTFDCGFADDKIIGAVGCGDGCCVANCRKKKR